MIHEFAVDPALLVEWSASAQSFAYFAKSFGLGEPRILALYPGTWKELAKKHWEELEAKATTDAEKGKLELQLVRFLELNKALSEVTVNRSTLPWVNAKSWLENALNNAPTPLETIIARQATQAAHVLAGDGLFDSACWNLDKGKCVPRDVTMLVDAVAPMLERCAWVIFVDPYWGPHSPDHMKPFKEFLRILSKRTIINRQRRVEIHTQNNEKKPDWNRFEQECKKQIEPCLDSTELEVRITWLKDPSPLGEKLHNRYIITDLGGIVFGAGLSVGKETQSDDLHLMSRAQYERRRDQYKNLAGAGSSQAFAVDKELILKGKPKPVPPRSPGGARGGRR